MRLRGGVFGEREFDYGLSTFGKSLSWTGAETFTLYFLTDVARIQPALAGAYVFALCLWSAICDPLVGWLLDRSGGRPLSPGYYRGCMALATGMFVLSFTHFSGPWSDIALLGSGFAFRAFYAAADVPHNALLAGLGEAGAERLGLSATRQIAALAGTLLVTAAAWPFLNSPAADVSRWVLIWAAGVSLLGGLLFLACLPKNSGSASPLRPSAAGTEGAGSPMPLTLLAVACTILSAATCALVTGAFSKDLVFIAKYVFDDATGAVNAVSAITAGRLLAVPVWWLIPKRIGVLRGLAIAWLIVAITSAALLAAGPDRTIFLGGLLLLGAGLGGVSALTWAVIPRLALELERRTRTRSCMSVFGLFTASTKIAGGLSGLALGMLLTADGIATGHSTALVRDARFYDAACLIPLIGTVIGLGCLVGLASAMAASPRRRLPARAPALAK